MQRRARVTFEPGARTAWHTHPLGQTLIVTAGCGRVQREGGPVEEIRPGDVVWFAPGEKHWHGAAPTTAMTHIAIPRSSDGKAVDWMEKVTDEQYVRLRARRRRPSRAASLARDPRDNPYRNGDMICWEPFFYGPRDVRCEEVAEPKILKPTDAIIRLSASCICGSDLWPYRGLNDVTQPMAMGHEYCGVVEEVGSAVTTVRPGPVRRRLVLPLRQHLSALPLRLPIVLRAARVHDRRAGAAGARSARRRHAGRDRRNCRRTT